MTAPDGAQAERTGLAWRRTTLGSAACTALLLHSSAQHHWGITLIPVLLAAATSVVLAAIGLRRERALRTPEPRPLHPAMPALASLAVTVTAASVVVLH